MAKDDNKKIGGLTGKLMDAVRDNISKLYTNTYFTQPTNANDLANIKKDILASIGDINTNNEDTAGMANISKLYTRLKALNSDKDLRDKLEETFSDTANMDDVMQSYMENKYLRDIDNEIDTICKYMPKLLEALDTRKDNVLSADHFSKDYITIPNSTSTNTSTFDKRIQAIKDKYDLLELFDTAYDNAAKYGEQFIYVVPYNKAIERLKRSGSSVSNNAVMSENGTIVIKEDTSTPLGLSLERGGINVEINTSGMLNDVVQERYIAETKLKAITEQSLTLEYSMYMSEAAKKIGFDDIDGKPADTDDEKKINKNSRSMDPTISDKDISVPKFMSSDGLVDPNAKKKEEEEFKIDIPGCIVKKLDRTLIKPIYIEDICLGYYYIELRNGEQMEFPDGGNILDPTMNLSRNQMMKQSIQASKYDQMLKQISAQISSFVDKKFVNNNIDLAKEIYLILKYNDVNNVHYNTMRISYLPPEDVVHIKFREDPLTHRGISDLSRAMFPAKLYVLLYLTNAIAQMTRGFDKRVYYVKQTVDNNIAKTLLTTINQLKKSNFGLRQIENINSVLNITGVLNDYLIPTSSNGDPPINFEVMQGQQINMPTELMDSLEEMAVNSTDVPIELIQARQSMDYAVQYTMTNSKFLRKIYHRQGQYQKFLSIIVTRIYNYEYQENVDLTVTLPPPIFLNITNTSQIINNTSDFASAIAEVRMAEEQNEVKKAIFTKKVKEYYLGSYLDTNVLDRIEKEATQLAALAQDDQPQE